MKIGQIFKYARPYNKGPAEIDGLPNYFHHVYTEDCKLPILDSGINPIQKIQTAEGLRCPAILISSSPHKIGSLETPWQDFFDPDNGHVHYFGDNKAPGNDPASALGNKALLEQFELHSSSDSNRRLQACPIICFKRVAIGRRAKGNVKFQGFGIISRAERITQYDHNKQRPFTNYVFDFTIFSLLDENEEFEWSWISARRNSDSSLKETLRCAPRSWKNWVKQGAKAIEKSRRRISKLLTYTSNEQKPPKGSREERVLNEIYEFYSNKKTRFEGLAAEAAKWIINAGINSYSKGWITPSTSDGGADFVGRLDIGSDLAKVKIIVLGQAKCEKPNTPTGGNHIARTVARLKRGWIGVYVTTSYFSEAVQREVIEDKYPIILVNGSRLLKEVLKYIYEQGYPDLKSFLKEIDRDYDKQVLQRDPEEILYT